MANTTHCFVLAFSRSKDGELRTEAAIKALSQQHARSAAFRMAAMNLGAIAFAGDPAAGEWEDAEILARFGDVPEDHALHYQLGGHGNARRVRETSTSGSAFANATSAAHTLLSRLPSIRPFVTKRERRRSEAPKRWLAIASLVTVGFAVSGSAALILEASAQQREARLMEMARPACSHTGTTNEELHRLVESEYTIGTSKRHALRAVITLCQANPRTSAASFGKGPHFRDREDFRQSAAFASRADSLS